VPKNVAGLFSGPKGRLIHSPGAQAPGKGRKQQNRAPTGRFKAWVAQGDYSN